MLTGVEWNLDLWHHIPVRIGPGHELFGAKQLDHWRDGTTVTADQKGATKNSSPEGFFIDFVRPFWCVMQTMREVIASFVQAHEASGNLLSALLSAAHKK